MKIIRNKTGLGGRTTAMMSLALLTAMAAGCASRDITDPGTSEEPDGIHLRLSVETGVYSRAGVSVDEATAAAERRIDDVLVMLFEPGEDGRPGRLLMSRTAESLTADAGEGTARRFDVRMPLSSYKDLPNRFRVMALANGVHLAEEIDAMKGKAYSVIRKDETLWRSEIGDDGNPLFTMWGCAGEMVEKDIRMQNISMRLLRDMAKVTVTLPVDEEGNSAVNGDAGFSLAHALVYNRRGEVSMLPDMEALAYSDGSGSGLDPYGVKTPAVLKDVNGKTLLTDLKKDEGYADALSPSGLTSISLYVPEQDILLGDAASVDDENAMKRPALIVGGYNGGDTEKLTWYRIDFTGEKDPDGNPILSDLLRNHHYRVNVKAVNGPGEETPELAYNTLLTKVETDVVDWTEVEWDAEFDGANWIAAQREVTVGAEEGDIAAIVLRSNVPAEQWSFSWDEEGVFEAKVAEDIEAEEAMEEDVEDENINGESTRLLIKVLRPLPKDMEIRTRVLTVKVTERLKFVINVIQTTVSGDDMHNDWKDDDMTWIFS